ncbi:MAG: shikimate dehydrogenase [Raoultibacter sp.]
MRKLYLLGKSISHSSSPVMHNALYRQMGLDWHYAIKDCATEQEARAFLEAREFIGLNVTMPYKPLACQMASVQASTAKLARGANVLARKGNHLLAFNVDGQGFASYLENSGCALAGKDVVVCGTGPTSLSVLHAVARGGAARVVLVGRDVQRAQQVLAAYLEDLGRLAHTAMDVSGAQGGQRSLSATYEDVSFSSGSYATSTQDLVAADLIVDATPCGMHPDDAAPFDTALLSAGQVVFDVVYGHGETKLLAAARAAGCQAFCGEGMLVAQAVATATTLFEINDVNVCLDTEEMFRIMADAAGFSC